MSVKLSLPVKKMKGTVYQSIHHISDLIEGEEYFSLKNYKGSPALQFGTVYLCGECKKPATVNTGWISGDLDESMHAEALIIGVVSELSYDDRFDNPDVCEECSMKKDKEESAA